MDSLPERQTYTWQERQKTFAGAWTARRKYIFKEFVSRQPISKKNCDKCHTHNINVAVRCMTCKQHLCQKCDINSHLHSPFHRRLLMLSESLKNLLPDQFIDEESNIITKGMKTQC